MKSALYVPGNGGARLDRAMATGADAVIVDLEDAVPVAAKDDARIAVAAWLRSLAAATAGFGTPSPSAVWVRINPGTLGHRDAAAVVGPWLAGLCVAKAE